MKMKRYGVNVRETAFQPQEKKGIYSYKSRGLHKAFNKGGIPFLVKSSKSPQINKICLPKNNTAFT